MTDITPTMPTTPILRRPDGSFLISSGIYHVPNEGEWADQWAELNAHSIEHPEDVTEVGYDYISPLSGTGGSIPMFLPFPTVGGKGEIA